MSHIKNTADKFLGLFDAFNGINSFATIPEEPITNVLDA